MPRWLRLLSKTTLTLGALGALVWTIEPDALLASLQGADARWIAVAALLMPVNVYLDGWVWSRLLDTIDADVSARTIGAAVLCGLTLGFWTPARLGEYAGRSFALPVADRWTVSLTVFVQRMVDMAVGVTVGWGLLVGALAVGVLPTSGPWLLACGIGGVTAGVLVGFLLAPSLLHRGALWGRRWLSGLAARTAFLRRLQGRTVGAVVGGSLLRYLVFTGQFVCLARALQPSASVLLLGAAVGLTFFVKYLIPSLTVLDLGLREGGAVFFFQLLGLGAATGLNAALLLFVLNVLVPAVVGLPFVTRLPVEAPEPEAASSTEFSSILSAPESYRP